MATDEKQWHQRFLKYMEGIVNNPNYKGLPINAWVLNIASGICIFGARAFACHSIQSVASLVLSFIPPTT